MRFLLVFIIFALLVLADKSITLASIYQVEKNYPGTNPLVIEKNPLAKWFFVQYGLIGGTIIYFFLSLILMFGSYYLMTMALSQLTVVYIWMMIYGLVIFNNIFFLLKHAGAFI